MKQRSVSIQDIARAAGVSHSTVSRALRESPLISPKVRQKIQSLAGRMGYVPNAVAQSLQGSATQTLGVLLTTVSDPFLADILTGVETVAREAGYTVLLAAAHNDPAEEIRCLDSFRKRRVDGLILASPRGNLPERTSHGLPMVLINPQDRNPPKEIPMITMDDRLGGRMAADHLIELGHRRIGYIGVTSRTTSNQRRKQGCLDALREAGIKLDPQQLREASGGAADPDTDVLIGRTQLPELLAERVTAVFCYNDMVALGALIACRELGVRVPTDISVIGFDDIAFARFTDPQLTTIRQPREEMGQMAMRALLTLLNGGEANHFVAQPTLVIRGSTVSVHKPKKQKSR
jgi:DNA-binding LacI/PurR family transcriptional regulator